MIAAMPVWSSVLNLSEAMARALRVPQRLGSVAAFSNQAQCFAPAVERLKTAPRLSLAMPFFTQYNDLIRQSSIRESVMKMR